MRPCPHFSKTLSARCTRTVSSKQIITFARCSSTIYTRQSIGKYRVEARVRREIGRRPGRKRHTVSYRWRCKRPPRWREPTAFDTPPQRRCQRTVPPPTYRAGRCLTKRLYGAEQRAGVELDYLIAAARAPFASNTMPAKLRLPFGLLKCW